MLRATRRGFRKPTFVISEAGRRVATLAGIDRRGCEFAVAGRRFQVFHEGRTRITLTGSAGYVATADGDGSHWSISSAAGRWEFTSSDSAWELRLDGDPIGVVRRESATAWQADLPGDLPLPLRVFVFYLALEPAA